VLTPVLTRNLTPNYNHVILPTNGSQRKENIRKAKAKQQIVYLSVAVTYSCHHMPSKLSARLRVHKIGQHLSQHVAGLSKFGQKLLLALSSQRFYF